MARWSLRGRTVLVTGAAGGIGAAVARELAERGARPALLDLDGAGARRVAATLGAVAIEADVAEPRSVQRGVGEAVERLGGLDAVVAAAAIAPVGSLRAMAPEEVERTIDVNLTGAYRTLHAALPHVVEAGGYLLAVSSLAAPVQVPLTGAYAAAKAGVDALTTALRLELAHEGVAVGVATFGWIDTPMVRAATADPGAALLRGRARGPMASDRPPERAARAVVRGIERRARTVAYPWWVRPVLALGPAAQRLAELDLRRAGPQAVRRSEASVPPGGPASLDGRAPEPEDRRVAWELEIDARFNGPPDSANGGYTCGLLAGFVGEAVEVTLRAPPPLNRRLTLEREDSSLELRDGETLVAEARPSDPGPLEPPHPVSFAEAEHASREGYERWTSHHPFRTCVVCGPDRGTGDGLRIFPGAVGETGLYAAPWVPDDSLAGPDGTVAPECVWASLDCPSSAPVANPEPGPPVVLARMSARLQGPVQVGQPHLLVSWELGREGRKRHAASALLTEDGEQRAVARALWIELRSD